MIETMESAITTEETTIRAVCFFCLSKSKSTNEMTAPKIAMEAKI